MNNSKLRANEIIAFFGNRPFTSDDLYNFYINYEPDLKKTTFRSRIYYLKANGIINTLSRGVYETKIKNDFEPTLSNKLTTLYSKIKKQFPYTNIAVWETSWLNNYMVHHLFSGDIILEVEKNAVFGVFAFVQESYSNVYLNPKKFEVENYLISGKSNIIIKNLTMTSPLTEKEGLKIPRIEKIMVDIFMDDDLFVAYQGSELQIIFKEFFKTFYINQSTLKQYASKRHVKDRLISFLKKENIIAEDK